MEILESLFGDGLSNLLIAILIFISLIIFQKDLRKLISWIITFRKISKSEKGYSFEGTSSNSDKSEEIGSENEVKEITGKIDDKEKEEVEDSLEKDWFYYILKKDYRKAIEIAQKGLEESKDIEVKIRFKSLYGHTLFSKDFEQGKNYFDNLLLEHQSAEEPYRWYALSLYWNGLYIDCINIIEKAFNNVDDKTAFFTIKANCQHSMGKTSESIDTLKNAIKSKYSNDIHYTKLVELLIKMKAEDNTILSLFERGLQTFPESEDILNEFAKYLNDNNKKDKELYIYRKLVRIAPSNPTYLSMLGNVYLEKGFNSLALDSYKKANELVKNKEAWIIANIGNIFNNQGFYTEAINYLNKAIEITPNFSYSHDRLSNALKLKEEESENAETILDNVKYKLYNSD